MYDHFSELSKYKYTITDSVISEILTSFSFNNIYNGKNCNMIGFAKIDLAFLIEIILFVCSSY